MIAKNEYSIATVEGLTRSVRGPVYFPFDIEYAAEASPFNLDIVPEPELIVGATCAADVVAAVKFAAANELPIAIQSTGHGIMSNFAGALLVTTKRMKKVEIDAESRRARVEPGVRWSEVVSQTSPLGLAPLTGSSSQVGVVGYSLGGGLPILGRKHGYAADHVRSIEIVTADGELRTASANENPDLFWALRGGKGNFGIVTAIEFDLFPVPEFYAGALVYPGARAEEVLRGFHSWTKTLPEDVSTSIAFMRLPPAPFIPEPLRGQFIVAVRFAYAGDAETGAALLAPMRDLDPSVLDTVGLIPYTQSDIVHMDPMDPLPVSETALSLKKFDEDTIAAFLKAVGPGSDTELLLVEMRLMGGALNRPPAQPNAVGNRDSALHMFSVTAAIPGTEAKVAQDIATLRETMAPFSSGSAVVNFLNRKDAQENTVSRAYEPESYARLREIKATYDPASLFRMHHTIK